MIHIIRRRVVHDIEQLLWWEKCVLLWGVTLVILTCVGLITVRIMGPPTDEGYVAAILVPADTIPGIWARWDSGWYIRLANEGYAAYPAAAGFFPLFPLLMAVVSRLTGWSLALSGMIIAHLSYLGSILMLYKLARLISNEDRYAMRAVLYMVLFPTSLFFFSVYAESLYLFFAVSGTYFVFRYSSRYFSSGLAFGMASIARPVGFLLPIIMGVEFLRRRDFHWRRWFHLLAAGLISGLGILIFVIYAASVTGSATGITDTQNQAWLCSWKVPIVPVIEAIAFIFDNSAYPDWFSYVLNIVDLAFTLFALAITLAGLRMARKGRFSWSLTIYAISYLMFVLARRGAWIPLYEMARWVAPLFPLYLILARLTANRRYAHWAVVVVFSGGLLLFTSWIASGRWVG
jgi:hypothetical protein